MNPILVDFAMLNPGYFTIIVVAGLVSLVALFHIFTR